MNGYHGQILNVDLTSGTSEVERYDEAFARAYLGGNGFAVRLLYDRLPAGTDPYDPASLAVFACGPISDTPVFGSSRAYTACKSPLTGRYFDSTFGGRFAQTLKRTGFEAVAISGRAEEPCYVLVEPGGASVLPARDLWGRSTSDTADVLRERHGKDCDVAVIGPAGEAGVRFACVAHYWQGKESFAGRGGLGAVLGSKNCKAVVVKGDRTIPVADLSGIQELNSRQRDTLRQWTEGLTQYGTAVLVEPINAMGGMGFRNNQWETDERASALSGETYRDQFFVKATSCARCPVACGKISKVEQGPYAPLTAKTPEYESLFSLGTMQELFDPAAVLAANRLCDELGVDTITMGVTLAFACECVEKDLLSREDVGFPLGFGNAEASLEAIRRTAAREGFGARLAEGSVRLAAEIGNGAERFLYAVRGSEIAAHSARILKGMSLGYATGTRGGSHHDTRPTLQYGPDQDNRDPAAQPAWAVRSQHFTAVGDSLAQCRLVGERGFGKMINDTYAEMIRHVTGWDVTADELERIGERIYNLERAFNVREGTRRAEDTLPYRVMNEPVPSGAHEGMHCPQAELDGMLDEYYRLRRWTADGVPTREKLEDLGLAGVADDLGV